MSTAASTQLRQAADRLIASVDFGSRELNLTKHRFQLPLGRGSECFGGTLLALQRLARANGSPLRAGQIVLSGALGPMVAVRPGSTYGAIIDGIGSVELTFEDER